MPPKIGPHRHHAPASARPPAKPAAPAAAAAPTAPAPVHAAGLAAPATDVSRRQAALSGVAPRPPAVPTTVAVAFDAIQAPGGPAGARLLDDGLDAWNARMDIIEKATTSIDTSYFIVEKDPFGFAFLGGLLKKQLQGVPVRMSIDAMADTFGTNGFKAPFRGRDYLQELVNHGGEAYVYHPVYERPLEVLKGDYSALASNHDKLLVVDGKFGITGGRNIAQDYFASPADLKTAWRDMDVLLDGAGAAGGLTEAFNAELTNGGASKSVGKDFLGNWDKQDIKMLGAYEMMNLWLKAPPFSAEQKTALRGDPAALGKLAAELVQASLSQVQADLPDDLRRPPSEGELAFLTEQATALVGHLDARGSRARYDAGGTGTHQTEVKIIDQTSAASGQRINNMAPALTALVEGATKRLVIENPYIVLTRDMLDGLARASERGVQIDIITNSPLSTDSDVTQAFFLEDWQLILARCPTARIFVATGERKFHTKSAVIDDDQTIVSTYNLDLLSGFVNGEVGAVVKSKELAADLTQAFDRDKADPNNGFIEYTIQKDADGHAVLKDGQPVSTFGPEDHLPPEVLEAYKKKRNLWGNLVRNNVPQFEPLRHDKLPTP